MRYPVCLKCGWIYLEDRVIRCEKCGSGNIRDVFCPSIAVLGPRDDETTRSYVRMCMEMEDE